MSTDPIRRATVKETGESIYAVAIEVSGHRLRGDEPQDAGGADLGPGPYDYLLAALGECTTMTVRWYAQQQQWPLDRVEVVVTHRKADATTLAEAADRTGRVDFFEKQVMLYGEKLSEIQRAKLHDVAAKCPVQRTLQSNPVIRSVEQIA